MALGQREKMLLGVLGAMALVAGLYFAFSWYTNTRAALIAQRDSLARELNQVKEKVRNMALTKQKLADAQRLQVELEQKVPSDEEVPQLLRDLSDMLIAAGVKLRSFKPSQATPSSLPEWNEIKVTISVSGTYRELIAMLNSLQNAKRLIGITNFNISGGGDGADPALSCSTDLLVYCLKRRP